MWHRQRCLLPPPFPEDPEAALRLTVLSIIVSFPSLYNPPPNASAWLSLTVLFLSVTVPDWLWTPPPNLLAVLLLTATLVRESVPSLYIPAPLVPARWSVTATV